MIINVRITNVAFFFFWGGLEQLCLDNNIIPTKRQASKFKNKKGKLWKIYEELKG